MPRGGSPACSRRPLTTRFVDVPTSSTDDVTMEAKASGRSSGRTGVRARRASPRTTGTRNAVAAVLLMNVLSVAAVSTTTARIRNGARPVKRNMRPPRASTTPVRESAAVRIRRPRITMTVSLPKPRNASAGVNTPVATSRTTRARPTTSGAKRPLAKASAAVVASAKTTVTGSIGRLRFDRSGQSHPSP
jgi:hypothetical protein